MPQLKLDGGKSIGEAFPPYIIAELNSSHGGDYQTSLRMIDAAKNAGCDCVKFQSWSADSLYARFFYANNPLMRRFMDKFALTPETLEKLSEYCKEIGIDFSSTPYSYEEIDCLANRCEAAFIKISSMDLNYTAFLKRAVSTGKPVILSTGMGTAEEILRTVETIRETTDVRICLLHCVSLYPCAPEDMNLKNILWLKRKYPDIVIGFSDHSQGTELAVAAVAMGACVIEKHMTLNRKNIGFDNWMATEPEEMAQLVKQCRNVYVALGSESRAVGEKEMQQRLKLRRSVVYTRNLQVGHRLVAEDLDVKRPGSGYPPDMMERLIGKTLLRDTVEGVLVSKADLSP